MERYQVKKVMDMSREAETVESNDPREGEVDQEHLSDDLDSSLLLPRWDAHKSSQLLRNPFCGCQSIGPMPIPTPEDSCYPRSSFQTLEVCTAKAAIDEWAPVCLHRAELVPDRATACDS